LLRQYGLVVVRKMAFIAIAWVVIFFISQPFRHEGVLMLVAPLIGAFVGLVAGWFMAERSVEESSLSGMFLWAILVICSVAPMWLTDVVLGAITHRTMDFGGFMLLTAASLMALASAVWHASSQE
jgi:hypothetical protein